MAMSNLERQRRWLEKNRALFNRRRREKRVLGKGGDLHEERSNETGVVSRGTDEKKSTLEVLRELISKPVEKAELEVVKPRIFRNDYGVVITEGQWEKLQRMKKEAKEGGYEIDEWSQ